MPDATLPGGSMTSTAPTINGEPKITQDAATATVGLEVFVNNADPTKTKWFFGEKELAPSDTYSFTAIDQGGGKNALRCTIKNFDKPLAGTYKVTFANANGQNSATFTVQAGNAPEFYDKPHIVQKDGGKIVCIKARAKSHLEITTEWFKDDKPVKLDDRIKAIVKTDDKDPKGFQYVLEISNPQKSDAAKYKCVIKNKEGQNQQALNLVLE